MIEQGSAEWVEARRAGIGGSEVSVLYGANPHTTAFALWAEKTGRVDSKPATIHDEPAMYWGSKLERQVRDGYADLTGREVIDGVTLLRHPNAPLVANTDGTIVDAPEHDGPGVYEGKIAGGVVRRKHWERDGKVRIPLHYCCQGQAYLSCTGYSWGSLAVLFGDRWDLRAIDFEVDRPFIANMLDRVVAWWTKHIVLDEPPPIDASPVTEAALRKVYASDDGRIVLLPDQFVPVLDQLLAQEKIAETADQSIQWLRNLVIAAMGSAAYGQLYDGRGFALGGRDGSRKLRKMSEAAMSGARRRAAREGGDEPRPAALHPEIQRQADTIAGWSWGIAPMAAGSSE
jgi:putative phage-type endonuclease